MMKTEDEFLGDVGINLQLIRLDKGWSQEQLSFASGVDRAHIAEIEAGKKNYGALTLKKICDALEIKISELYSLSGE